MFTVPEDFEDLISDRAIEWNGTIEPPQNPLNKKELYKWGRVVEEIESKGLNLKAIGESLEIAYGNLYQLVHTPKFKDLYQFLTGKALARQEKEAKKEDKLEEIKNDIKDLRRWLEEVLKLAKVQK